MHFLLANLYQCQRGFWMYVSSIFKPVFWGNIDFLLCLLSSVIFPCASVLLSGRLLPWGCSSAAASPVLSLPSLGAEEASLWFDPFQNLLDFTPLWKLSFCSSPVQAVRLLWPICSHDISKRRADTRIVLYQGLYLSSPCVLCLLKALCYIRRIVTCDGHFKGFYNLSRDGSVAVLWVFLALQHKWGKQPNTFMSITDGCLSTYTSIHNSPKWIKIKDRRKKNVIELRFEYHHSAWFVCFLLGYFNEWEPILKLWYLGLTTWAFAVVLFSSKRRDYLKRKHSASCSMDEFSELNGTDSVSCIKLKPELKKMSTDKNNCSEDRWPRMEELKAVTEISMWNAVILVRK